MKEQLSALVDNELNEFEERRLLQELERDALLRASWQRYHLMRAALRNELEQAPSAASTERLIARLAAEPAAARGGSARRRVARAAAGLAIAATVATVALFGLQTLNRPGGPQTTPVASSSPVASTVLAPAASVTPVAAQRPAGTNWETLAPEEERILNAYLVQHSEFASAGMRGMLPSYVRVIGYKSDQ
jgi:sigma-E factor negative regulatory protein RseA